VANDMIFMILLLLLFVLNFSLSHVLFHNFGAQILIDTAKAMGVPHHTLGTAITIEGPRFSSRAESHVWRSWGASIVNMTTVPEVSAVLLVFQGGRESLS
jgi:purine nucleoside phosphorylase